MKGNVRTYLGGDVIFGLFFRSSMGATGQTELELLGGKKQATIMLFHAERASDYCTTVLYTKMTDRTQEKIVDFLTIERDHRLRQGSLEKRKKYIEQDLKFFFLKNCIRTASKRAASQCKQ